MRRYLWLSAVAVALAGASSAHAENLLSQTFSATPVGTIQGETPTSSTGRFDFSASGVTAHYNSAKGGAMLVLPLSRAINQNESFQMTVNYTILGTNYYADPNGFTQLSFGLVNTATTGWDRATGTPTDTDDAKDTVSVDYFPNITTAFETPSYATTLLGTNGWSSYAFPQTKEAGLSVEGDLPRDVALTAHLTYNASTHVMTLSLATPSGPLHINTDGPTSAGYDGDDTTIQTFIGTNTFDVNAFALSLWNDPFGSFDPGSNTDPDGATARADLTFTSVDVVATPEPGTLALLASGAALLLARRRR